MSSDSRPVDQLCAPESCAAEEDDVLGVGQCGPQMRDRVIAPYLLLGGTEPLDLMPQVFVAKHCSFGSVAALKRWHVRVRGYEGGDALR